MSGGLRGTEQAHQIGRLLELMWMIQLVSTEATFA
jgi:hypothetical protein